MSKTAATNATSSGAWSYGNATSDQFAKEDVQNLGANFDAHDHTSTKGVRLVTGSYTDASVTGVKLSLGQLTNSLGADVLLNNTGTYFDGPSVAQGTSGTWFATGTITVTDSAGAANIDVQLHDGTTVIASCRTTVAAGGQFIAVSLSGYLANPAGNIRMSAKDVTSTNGTIKFNSSSNSKDSTVSAFRIG